jgi:hypothetical protein
MPKRYSIISVDDSSPPKISIEGKYDAYNKGEIRKRVLQLISKALCKKTNCSLIVQETTHGLTKGLFTISINIPVYEDT